MKDLGYIYMHLPELEQKGIDYNDEYKEARNNREAYEKLKDGKDPSKWTKFKKTFIEYTGNRCSICERDLDQHGAIEHYRPKEYYWWLAYDFYNYYVCCFLCNTTYKGKKFPVEGEQITFETKDKLKEEKPLLFNPLKDDPLELFELELVKKTSIGRELVFIRPNRNLLEESYEYKKAQTTIDLFNLNNSKVIGTKKIHDTARFQTMINHGIDLFKLLKKRKDYLTDEYDETKRKRYRKNLRRYLDQKKLYLAKFIEEGLYKEIKKQ